MLRAAWHVLVHLRPAPIVARVTGDSDAANPDDVARELGVARHAARAGAPVVQPTDLLDPGPHEYGGRTMVFWRFIETSGPADPREAGLALRAVHDALADYDGALPPANRAADVESLVASLPPSDDTELLRELSLRELPAGQAVHGDAHLGNCLPGPVWHDFETACRGPREFDLAALVMGDRMGEPDARARAALAAYGEHDADLVDECLPAYAAWICASFLTEVSRRPELAPVAEAQLRYLRGRRRG